MRLATVSLLCIALFASPGSWGAKKDLPKTEGWIEVSTEHFTLTSNANEGRTKKIAIELERFRQFLAQISRGFDVDTDVPTSMFVFKNDYVYTPYKTDRKGQVRNVAGYFQPTLYRNYITLDLSAGTEPMRVVLHEYFHAVSESSIGNIPTWLSEGLAEYFSTFTFNDSSLSATLGKLIEGHPRYIGEHGLLPWEELFSTTTKSPTYNEGTRQGSFYAQSWLLTHYLNSSRENVAMLGRYLTGLRAGMDEDEAFEKAFGYSKLEAGKKAEAYLAGGWMSIKFEFDEKFPTPAVNVRELEPAELLFRLGDLLAQSGPRQAAERHLAAAAEQGWHPGEIAASRGIAAYKDGDSSAAEAEWGAAIESKAPSIVPYTSLAGLKIEQIVGSHDSIPAEMLEARTLLEKSLAMDPNHYYSLLAYASTFTLGDGEIGPALQTVEKARSQRPLDIYAMTIHAPLLAHSGKIKDAFNLVYRFIEPRDEATASETERSVVFAVQSAASEKISAEDREGATAVLDEALEQLRSATLREQLLEWRRVLTSGADIILGESDEKAALMEAEMDAFNSAISMLNEGRLDEAKEIFTRISTECTVERLCKRSTELIAEIDQRVAEEAIFAKVNKAVELVNGGSVKEGAAMLREALAETTDPAIAEQIRDMLKQIGE